MDTLDTVLDTVLDTENDGIFQCSNMSELTHHIATVKHVLQSKVTGKVIKKTSKI